jgi:hypothetical protein
MNDLLDNVYLPDLKKRSIRESDAYKLLKDNNKDTSVLEGYDNTENIEPIEFPVFNTQGDKDKFIEENATSTASTAKDYLETFGNFLTDETEDLVTSLQLAAVNGADVAVNLMPLAYKMFEKAPIAMAMPKEFFNTETEEDVMRVAKHYSDNLGEYRKHLFEKQKDNGWVKDILSLVVQDSAYSIPAFNMMRKAGVPKYPAFFLSAAFGAIGVENVDRDGDKTYFAPFQKDVQELKKLLNILPDTPADKIADEVHQALEYGSFGTAIPGIIDAFVFMKKYLPKFSTVTGSTAAVAGLSADNEAEGSPIKSILKAVDSAPMFKSAVVDAADNIPTVASGDQIFNTIKNTSGVKESELKWMDLEGFLKGKNKVSKDEVLEYINTNKIDVTEVTMSSSSKKGLPDDFRKTIDEYETRWRDSDLADGVTPNYDVYKFKSTTYKDADLVNGLGEPTQATTRANLSKDGLDVQELKGDFQSMNRNPLLQAMDADAEIFGTGTSFKVLKSMLTPWMDDATGKYTGYVVDLKFPIRKGSLNKKDPDYDYFLISGTKNRVLVPEVSLDSIGEGNFTRIMKYEIDELELEKFNIEDDIRQFRLNNTDQSPVYEKYTSPGGTDYTELVFKIKNKEGTTPAVLEGEFGTLAGNKVKSEVKTTIDYKSPHFNKMNEFAHVRFKTRYLDNGKKVLTVEEMQSDLLQASKTDMFSSANSNMRKWNDRDGAAYADKVLKDFPFKNNWYEFTIKRLTRYAADNGFDAIAIPKGELAANRYGKSILKIKSVDVEPMAINRMKKDGVYYKEDDRGFFIRLNNENGEKIFERTIYGVPGDDKFFENFSNLSKDVGESNLAEIQQLILQADDTDQIAKKVFEKTEVAGTGKGKYNLYDKTIPGYMKKYAKKWNAKVYDDSFLIKPIIGQNTDMPVTILELSDEMKQSVQTTSQPLFELFGGVSLSTWGAKAVSDSMKNNTISQTTN